MKRGGFGCKNRPDGIGVLVAQLGTPDAPTPAKVRPYLRQFLSDPRVIEKNRLLWWFILRLCVLTTRPKRSAALYQRIWSKEGSPLLVITKRQTERLRERLKSAHSEIHVEFGMRYGRPSLKTAIDALIERGCSKILLFPMYPQYSATTTASTYDVIFSHLLRRRWVPTLRVAEPYYANPNYIRALAETINSAMAQLPVRLEKLVFSYHGIPEAYIERGDPYCCHCTETSLALIPQLKVPPENIIHTYQSRFGRDPWLVPYTDETIRGLAEAGVKKIAVACPGFTADCLETLDEIGNEARHLFLKHGGEELVLIPCLNDHPAWIQGMAEIVLGEIHSWLDSAERASEESCRVRCPVKLAKAG